MENRGFYPDDDRLPTPSSDSVALGSVRPLSTTSAASSVVSSDHRQTPEPSLMRTDDKHHSVADDKHHSGAEGHYSVADDKHHSGADGHHISPLTYPEDPRPHSNVELEKARDSGEPAKDGVAEAYRYDADKKALEALGEIASVDLSSLPAMKPYAGMGKEDLLRFSQTPFWNGLRLFCTCMFWLTWAALLGTVIALTVTFPKCEPPPEQPWYQSSVIYQIYVRSFYDYNGDGIGDIEGIRSKLDYLADLNVDAILLSSFYESDPGPQADFGYEVTNHKAISTEYGTIDDFDVLVSEAHDMGMKVILDFIPNYTGTGHPWFKSSANSSEISNEYWNYYVWRACTDGADPVNNWLTVYNQSMWTSNDTRGGGWCYLHQFLDSQPELNLRSTSVQAELESILRFWLDRDVDGFRVDKAMHLFEDVDLRDEPMPPGCMDYDCMSHNYTTSQEEIYPLIAKWREILDAYTEDTGRTRVLLTDAMDTVDNTVRYYGKYGPDGAHLPINYQLTHVNMSTSGRDVFQLADAWLYGTPIFGVANWLTGNHDITRLGSQFEGYENWGYQNCLTLMKLTLPGVAMVYYGEEIGMADVTNMAAAVDPAGLIDEKYSRDPYRTPMQWTEDDNNAGFVNESGSLGPMAPWLGVGPDLHNISVEAQNTSLHSPYEFYRELVEIRRSSASFSAGTFQWAFISDNVLSFYRGYDGYDRYVAVMNFGPETSTSDVSGSYYPIASSAEVVMTTKAMDWEPGDSVGLSSLELDPGEGLLVKWPYTRPDGKPKNNP